MKKFWFLFAGLALAFTLVLPAAADAACICTKIYKPVCAIKGTTAKTYGNACEAGCVKARICAQGKCRPCPVYSLVKPRPGCRYVWYWKGCCRAPKLVCKPGCVCPRIYKPVCARKGNTKKTYSNACVARCDRARVCAQGKCSPCPVFRLAKPKPGCRYVWYWKGCCRLPRLVCKQRPPYCTKLRCVACNKSCQARQKACIARANSLNSNSVKLIRARCAKAAPSSTLWRCLCAWAKRRASEAVILRGMKGCYLTQCRNYKCCRTGRKLCYPHPPNVRCVKAPCCRKLVCNPARCR